MKSHHTFMQTTCITDMGLCKPAYYDKLENTDNTVFGIIICLDANPSNRPNAKDLSRTINEWNIELNQYRNKQPELVESELIKQMLDINDNSSSTNISNLPFTHPGAIYASRPFKFNNLPEPKNSNNYYENCDNITEMIYSGELLKSNSECLECEIVN
ncbi:unnamed protein product [Rhizophagus irregularis]|nr:unnamed protein product [Rhizophagus irregularis]